MYNNIFKYLYKFFNRFIEPYDTFINIHGYKGYKNFYFTLYFIKTYTLSNSTH